MSMADRTEKEAEGRGEPTVDLTPEEEAELAEAIREVERGHVVTADELLKRLRHPPGRSRSTDLP
jgi:hypothetical protein